MPARHRDERGATAVLVAVLMSAVLLVSAAFAVDLGQQRVVRRDMQAVADVVALDIARELNGRTRAELLASGDVAAAAAASAGRNDHGLGGAPEISWTLGKIDDDGDFVAFDDDDDDKRPTAVRVSAEGSTDFAFGGVTGRDRGAATRSAVSRVEKGACFTVGTYAARIRLGDGTILGPLMKALGTDVGLTVLDAQGLAATDIKLLDLVNTGLIAGGFDDFVDANVKLGSLYLAMAQVLQNQGGHAAQVALLQKLATVAVKDVVVNVADILGLDTTSSSALDAAVNLFDLVSTAAFVANGENSISVPDLNVNVLGLSTLTASVKIGQKPIQYCGRAKSEETKGESNQVEVNLRGNLANLNLGLVSISAPITLTLKLTPADVQLDDVRCLTDKKLLDFVTTSGLTSLEITIGDPANKNNLSVKALLGLVKLVDGYIRLYTTPAPAATETKSATVDSEDYDGSAPVEFGTDSLGVPYLHQDTHLNVLGILPAGGLLGAVINPLLSIVVNPLVATLDSVLLTPLLRALGINVAGADVYAKKKADCGLPQLVG
ncbi:hypothetical protein [Nocardioides humi]|uniref:Flp pilus-assembly TadG-like N-terminal domain-containing protein n=1 Tax=Nocardioides humi TaxID=449461 RepID=A0ABN2ALI4_9ACTN|nr:hypothetical protein [Nocardioides humi]